MNGASVHSLDGNRYTPLHHAASSGHEQVCLILHKEFQALLSAQDQWGRTPSRLAYNNGHYVLARKLLELGTGYPDGTGQ